MAAYNMYACGNKVAGSIAAIRNNGLIEYRPVPKQDVVVFYKQTTKKKFVYDVK